MLINPWVLFLVIKVGNVVEVSESISVAFEQTFYILGAAIESDGAAILWIFWLFQSWIVERLYDVLLHAIKVEIKVRNAGVQLVEEFLPQVEELIRYVFRCNIAFQIPRLTHLVDQRILSICFQLYFAESLRLDGVLEF